MDGDGSDVKYGFPALALCQFCDNCGPRIVLLSIYDANKDLEPHVVLPRETKICKICLINENVPSITIDEKIYAVLRHSCIYSLTAESPLCKYSTYSDKEGWRLMLHFIVKDIYGRGTVRRLSLVFYSVFQRPFDIANIAEKMSEFSNFYRAKALEVFDAEKDSVSEWRMQSANVKQQHARNFCNITGVSVRKLCEDLAQLTKSCNNTAPPKPFDLFAFEDVSAMKQMDFTPLVELKKMLTKEADFTVLMTKLVQGDQIIVVSASDSPSDTKFADKLVAALGGLLPSKLAQIRFIGDDIQASTYAEAWQFNLVALSDLKLLPQTVIDDENRTLVLVLKNGNSSAEFVSKWLNEQQQKPCSLGKRYTLLFSAAVDCSNHEHEEDEAKSFDISEFVRVMKAEFVLESKLVYALTRLPDANFQDKTKRKSLPPTPADRTKKVEECAQLAPGDFCQALFWASALPGETRKRIVDTSDRNYPPTNFSSPEVFNVMKELFLH